MPKLVSTSQIVVYHDQDFLVHAPTGLFGDEVQKVRWQKKSFTAV